MDRGGNRCQSTGVFSSTTKYSESIGKLAGMHLFKSNWIRSTEVVQNCLGMLNQLSRNIGASENSWQWAGETFLWCTGIPNLRFRFRNEKNASPEHIFGPCNAAQKETPSINREVCQENRKGKNDNKNFFNRLRHYNRSDSCSFLTSPHDNINEWYKANFY